MGELGGLTFQFRALRLPGGCAPPGSSARPCRAGTHKAPEQGPTLEKGKGPGSKGRGFALTCHRPTPQSAKSNPAASAAAHCHPLQLGAPARPGSNQPTMPHSPQLQAPDPDPPPAHPFPQAQAHAGRSSAPGLVPGQPGKWSLHLRGAPCDHVIKLTNWHVSYCGTAPGCWPMRGRLHFPPDLGQGHSWRHP